MIGATEAETTQKDEAVAEGAKQEDTTLVGTATEGTKQEDTTESGAATEGTKEEGTTESGAAAEGTKEEGTTESGAAVEVAKEEVAKEQEVAKEEGVAVEGTKAGASPPADEAGAKRAIDDSAEEPAQKKQTPVKEQKVTKEAAREPRTTRVTNKAEVC